MNLPRTAKEVVRLKPLEWIFYNGVVYLARVTGLWRRPIRAIGDIEKMGRVDKAYWLYKTIFPITRARRGSGLEDYFARQRPADWRLPDGFQPKESLTISSAGDLIGHPYLPNSAKTLYAAVKERVFGADLPMANLECVVLPGATGKFEFTSKSGPPLYYDHATFDIVRQSEGRSFAFVAAACNHSLDFGLKGVEQTIWALRQRGMAFNGVNETADAAASATILAKNGLKIGLIAYTFGLNGYRQPGDQPWIVNLADINGDPRSADFRQFEKQVEFCRREQVDFIVLHLHWGLEHEFYPTPEQVAMAHRFAELGADAIIGHHPHVVQPREFYRTQRDADRVVPIFYSLGNLINTFSAPYLCISAIAQIRLVRGTKKNGEVRTYVQHADQQGIRQVVNEAERTISLQPCDLNDWIQTHAKHSRNLK